MHIIRSILFKPARIAAAIALGSAALIASAESATPDPASIDFFEKRVRPVFVDNCYNCHSANTNAKGGLRVDDRAGLVTGGNRGAAVVPGDPDNSLLLKAIRHDGDLKMPPKKQLTPEQIADVETWVRSGAAWPAPAGRFTLGKTSAKYERLLKEHWAWQQFQSVAAPQLPDDHWSRDDVDRFIAAKLRENNLKPAPDADKPSLLRRVTFDLTGLPPTPAEIDAFTNDSSADAYEKVVDRLLASSAFGERWGRHWLDVARYGESTGSSRNVPYPHAWRYRDYVIDSINADKPYDRFVREQIAGDLLPADSDAQRDRQVVATGFLALGVKDVNQRFKIRFVMDNIDEQIDTVTRSVLGVTASCARCHDHKFDPIPQSDYYALAGIFNSTDLCAGVRNKMGGGGLDYYDPQMLVPLGSGGKSTADPEKVASLQKTYDDAKAEWDAIRGTPRGTSRGPDGLPVQRPYRLRMEKALQELLAVTDPAATGSVAHAARDAKTIGDTELRIRGEAEKLGPVVPRGFLGIVDLADVPKPSAGQSGRLELAQWLTDPRNPLTSRVIVNRAWHHLFGQGIVTSVDNFGVTGDAPSHPELLDHLANRFIQEGWSIKKLVRALVLTRAYQLSSDASPENLAADPANRFVWRHSPRRLAAEEIRDATLAAAGTLVYSRPEASPAKDLKVMEIRNNGPEARRISTVASTNVHRSVYLPLLRALTPTSLEVFDFAEQGMVTGSRDATTVATQALYLLNDPFVRRNSLALATSLLRESSLGDAARVDRAYRLILNRAPSSEETFRAARFLAEFDSATKDVVRASSLASAEEPKPVASAPEVAAASTADAGASEASAKPQRPANFNVDEAVPVEAPVVEEVVKASDARTAAWAAFCQALFGSAEFRYLR